MWSRKRSNRTGRVSGKIVFALTMGLIVWSGAFITWWVALAIGDREDFQNARLRRVFYFDSEGGNDTNSGLSPERALRSLERLSRLKLKPGDAVLFRRGCTFRGRLKFKGNGTPNAPLRLGAYGKGPNPKILGSVRLTDWKPVGKGIYKAQLPKSLSNKPRMVYSVFLYNASTLPVRFLRSPKEPPSKGQFFYSPDEGAIYLNFGSDDPNKHHIEATVIDELLNLTGRQWLVLEDLTFLFGNRRHIVINASKHIVIRRCASMFVGYYGNPNIIVKGSSSRVEIVDCFLYDGANGHVRITDGSTKCVVKGNVILKTKSNDGVTMHCKRRDKQGRRYGLAGNNSIVENNIIGLCGEQAIDVTSGDFHIVRGNICFGNKLSGIVIGHDADHILVDGNIFFNNGTQGILVKGKEEEGSRGRNKIVGNLIYENGAGIDILIMETEVINNTIVNSRKRPAVRVPRKGEGAMLCNNIIAIIDRRIPFTCLQFSTDTVEGLRLTLKHNLFFHWDKHRVIRTSEGMFSLEEFVAR
ncbi:MAG TPA: right-handed parallel beta-helix repeat-containing protein, partial [Armatimonadetes bacterium]|nr:right-handed parallel beta-helix repeat-containing protein [Armatimonadota bacterium]